MNKGRITYRFEPDGSRVLKEDEFITLEADEVTEDDEEEEPVQKEQVEDESQQQVTKVYPVETSDGQYLNQFTNDFGAWTSPFQTETEKLEKLIRDTEKNSRDGQAREMDEERDTTQNRQQAPIEHSLLDYEQEMDTLHDNPLRYIRRSGKAWLKIFTSFTGAVVTGLILGILVLSFFTNDDPAVDAVPEPNEPGPNVGAPVNDAQAETPSPADRIQSDQALAVHIPAESYVLLQNGVFSTREAATAAIDSLRTQGFAAVMSEENEQYYVFAGVLNNRDDALALSQVLQTSEFETFIKTLDLAAIDELRWGMDDSAAIENYFTGAHRLVQMLIDFSAIHLQNGAASTLEQSSMDAVKSAHQSWNMAASTLALEDEAINAMLDQMNNELNTAVVSLEEYHKSPAASYQWQVQHSLLQFLLQYKQLTDRT